MTHFRNAFVTGASSGIGAALTRELAARGTSVWICARRVERLEALAEELRGGGAKVVVSELDVRDSDAVARTVREADRSLGGLDLVVANAGVGRARHASRLTAEEVRETLDVNVLGATATLMAGLEVMRSRDRGVLCGVSSLASLGGMPTSGAYSASKAALATFLETLAIDLRGCGVRVVDVQPGFVVSEMTADAPHPQPFLWPVERAARRIVDDLERGVAISTFPWQLSIPLRLASRAPRWLWRAALAWASPRRSR